MKGNAMYVIPKSGILIRDPDLKTHIPPEGREVPDSLFWQRRINDGDVTVGKAPTSKSSASAPAKAD
jgi:hypothetical protein